MNIYKDLRRLCYKSTSLYFRLYFYRHSKNKDYKNIKRINEKLPKEGKGKDLFIVLNGPSIKNQDLSLLKGKDLMFVNRGFLHPLYKELQPKYHVFVDYKFANGIWPLEWLEQIFEMCPSIRIILPASWHKLAHFAEYKNDPRIFWQSWVAPFYLIGVSANCISYGISQQFDNIFFTGFDANSCAYDMIKSAESHFYGSDPELSTMSTIQHISALYTTCLEFYDLIYFSKYCQDNNVNVYNLTHGGVLDMFPRRKFEDPYNKKLEIAINTTLQRMIKSI